VCDFNMTREISTAFCGPYIVNLYVYFSYSEPKVLWFCYSFEMARILNFQIVAKLVLNAASYCSHRGGFHCNQEAEFHDCFICSASVTVSRSWDIM
jgi:hypothetical protein